jgi:hypothetical protein
MQGVNKAVPAELAQLRAIYCLNEVKAYQAELDEQDKEKRRRRRTSKGKKKETTTAATTNTGEEEPTWQANYQGVPAGILVAQIPELQGLFNEKQEAILE